jgi:Domain of unknown function (DUF4440)
MQTRRTPLPAVLIALTALLCGACPAADKSPAAGGREAALRAAELARFAANVNGDSAALAWLLDDDLDYPHANGRLENKAQFLEALRRGTLRYASMVPTLERVRMFGDVALVRGTAQVHVTGSSVPGGSSEFAISFDDVWLWKDGRWQMTRWRSTRLPEDPAK